MTAEPTPETIAAPRLLRDIPAAGGIAFAVNLQGHRQSYLDLFEAKFGLMPMHGAATTATLARLIESPATLFITLDDHVATFTRVALERARLRRPTVGLFLRPHACFAPFGAKSITRRALFTALKHAPGLTVATITPFEFAPEFAAISHRGLADPQYWDLLDRADAIALTPLAREIKQRAAGRRIVTAIGQIEPSKGHDFLLQALQAQPDLAQNVLVTIAGEAHRNIDLAMALREAGALVIDRFLSDAEVESLYRVSDAIWGCYAPERDQASGVSGRAFQLGVPLIAREGAIVARVADHLGARCISVGWNDAHGLAARLGELQGIATGGGDQPNTAVRGKLLRWREEFFATIGSSLR
jgi:hypothetical protein